MKALMTLLIALLIVGGFLWYTKTQRIELPQGETTVVEGHQPGEQESTVEPIDGLGDLPPQSTTPSASDEETSVEIDDSSETAPPSRTTSHNTSSRTVLETDGVRHSIPVEEIRQGCYGRDCIPSVDEPVFVDVKEANKLLPENTVGIGLVHKNVTRFYPFNMLVTREIVNDTIAGDPLVVTYCPLCGTGIVFDRTVAGETIEFGVSGMLWQSNLLMYNRAADEADISLWSQVLGEAVLGTHTGTKLSIVPSDIVRYTSWRESHPNTEVLNTGRIGDPYDGDYYRVARSFNPDFDENNSPLGPTDYVFGVDTNGSFKAYPRETLPEGTTKDTVGTTALTLEKKSDGAVTITNTDTGAPVRVVEGFWFSWVAAHPETELFE